MRIETPARSDTRSDCWPRKPEFGGALPAPQRAPRRIPRG